MIKGNTSSGFEFEIPKDALDNMELLDALADSASKKPLAMSRVVSLLLGNDLRDRLYEHVRGEDGRVRATAVNAEVAEILAALGSQGKN